MEKLVSCWFNAQNLPENYIFPPDTRPGKLTVPLCNTIPVIDLAKAEDADRSDIIEQILKASQDFGFFQVINHGVPENLMAKTMDLYEEFFDVPAEYTASLYSEDPSRLCRLYTSSHCYASEEVHFWRDNLRHPCHPLEKYIQLWPQKPNRYREIVGTYSVEIRNLSLRILELIGEGLGLQPGYFGDELTKEQLISVNHYPPSPDPSLTLGLPKHCDPDLITILQQGEVNGLQVFKDGQWLGVEPRPKALVANIGYILQIISNGRLKSAEHRVVTNGEYARTTIVTFINPCYDTIVEPAKPLISPPLYRAFQYKEFLADFTRAKAGLDTQTLLGPYKLASSELE